ncbi:MAG TPA: hypothetical protein O0X42_04420, partial [Methanocorpusculum sp.]|nr:hypothetical protein [Methanocorpusculum sp.]
MSNTELFDDGPRLLKCDGCGRYFEEPLLKRCRACGKLFCAECRTTHDCREPVPASVASSAVPPVIVLGIDENLGSTKWERETPLPDELHQRKYTPITFIDDEKNSIGSADVRRNEEPKTFGSYSYEIPVPEAPCMRTAEREQPACHDAYVQPQPESQRQQPVYHGGYVPPYAGSTNQQAPVMQPPETCGMPAAAVPACGPDELICDDCGRVWKKTDLRRCKKCGAVLCPNCREKHKCKKNKDKIPDKNISARTSSPVVPDGEKYTGQYHQAQQNAEPNLAAETPDKKKARKEKAPRSAAEKKSHGKLILIIVLGVI